jgi:valyl-tRNA synthetase
MNLDRAREAGVPFALPTQTGGSDLDSAMWTGARRPLESRWIVTRLSQTAATANASLTDYRFDEAANHIYQFFWGDLCDWYLEIVKLRFNFDDPADKAATSAALTTLVAVFESALRLLSPFMPFLTEEIWHALYAGNPPAKSIALTLYPQASDYLGDPVSIIQMDVTQSVIVSVRALRKELGVPDKEFVPIRIASRTNKIGHLADDDQFISRLARVREVAYVPHLSGAQIRSTPDFDLEVIYERQIDVPAERERLTKDLAKYEKGLAAAERQLGNEAFMAKAPVHIVEGLRKQAAETRTLYEKTKAALDALPASD